MTLFVSRLVSIATPIMLCACAAAHAAGITYPESPKKPVTDTYHGVSVSEDYRWLEENDATVKAWSAAQLRLARSQLDAVPGRVALKARLKDLYGNAPVKYYDFVQRGALFAMKRQPPKNQPFLVMMKSPNDVNNVRVIVDPNRLNAKGTTAIDFYAPSIDGKYVAVSLSENGSEDGSVYVFETATGKKLKDVIPRVQYPTGGGSVAWNESGSGFYYTRYPQGSERASEDSNFYQQVYFHALGTPSGADTYAIGKEFPRIAETKLSSSRDGRYVLASVANGDGGEFSFHLKNPAGQWVRVADHADLVREIEIGEDGKLYALSLKDSPRGKILVLPIDNPDLANAKLLVAQGEATIDAMRPTKSRLYLRYMVGGPTELRAVDLNGKPLPSIPTEAISSVELGVSVGGDDILVGSESYVTPFAWHRYSAASGKLVKTALAGAARFHFNDAVAEREMATSRDGTQVPVNILMRANLKRDGSHPLLLYGYGGYGLSETPNFSAFHRVWLDHGGVMVNVNLRGGGEFGEAWHLAGNLTNKQNVFDDMIGAAEHLIKRGYTTKENLAAMGGSNGGLLMGAILTQRPELFRTVVSQVGIYDMLRVELSPNGAFNVTEFGTVKDPAHFKALYAYSPYHNVKNGTAYPSVLFTTGENDGRVEPSNSRKMTARLQAATASGRPILLRISANTGHGIGTGLSERIEETADTFSFLFSQLGMK